MRLHERCALVVVASLVAAAALAASPATAGAQRIAIASGTIVDQDGNPLEGVRVSIEYWYMGPRLSMGATGAGDRETINENSMRQSGNSTETKEDGTFSYPSLDAEAEYRVRFEKDGFIPLEMKRVFHVAGNDMGTLALISGNVEAARKGYETGYEAFEKRDFPAAIAGMTEVVDVYGDSDSSDEMLVVALGVLGQAHLQLGQPAEAEASLTRLLEIRLDNPIAHRGLGQVAAMNGDMQKALDHFGSAVALEPESAVGRYLYGYALQLSGRAAEAIPQLEACLEAQPSFVQAHKSLGMALADTGETAQAIEHLEAYLKAAPGAPDAAEVQAKLAEIKGLA